MSFSSSSQQPKFFQSSIPPISSNVYGSVKKSQLSLQMDKNKPNIIPNAYSQRPSQNNDYTQISNSSYTNTARATTNGNTGNKLNEMSSDLAKLKQQLSKIMSQADKFEKKSILDKQPNLTKPQGQTHYQSFSNKKYTQQTIIPVRTNNKNVQHYLNNSIGSSPQLYKRMTESSKALNTGSSLLNIKTNNFYLDQATCSQKKPQKIHHSQSEKVLNLSIKKYSNYTNQQSINPQTLQKPQINKILQQKYETINKFKDTDQKPVLKIKDQCQRTIETNLKHHIQQKLQQKTIQEYNNTYQSPKLIQQEPLINTFSPQQLTKKPSTNFSHQLIVNRILNQQLSKKLEDSSQMQILRKKKQQEEKQYQQKIIQLQHEKRKLKHQVNNALLQKQNVQLSLKTQKSQRQALSKKYQELEDVFRSMKLEFQESKSRYKLLQRKLDIQLSRPKVITQPTTFDEALKTQITQISKYKQQLEQKDEQINRLKDINTVHRRQIDSLHNQIKIEQLKATSQVNQCQQKHSIVLQDKENEIKSQKNLIATLEAKLQVAVKQNKTKDAFMVQHLTGKAKLGQQKQYIQNFFKKYEIQFPSNKFGDKLREQLIQIQRLKKTILQLAGSSKKLL